MAAEHETVLSLALVEATRRGWRLFKNAIGLGFVGRVAEEYDSSAGHVVELVKARRVKYGVCNPGGFDLIGWQTVRITQDMVGMRVAVFAAIDGKTQAYSSMSRDQKNFAREVIKAGGIAIIATRSKDGETVEFVQLGPEDFNGGRK
jgi:hypothetical protein